MVKNQIFSLGSGQPLCLEAVNSRLLKISPISASYEIRNSEGHLVGLNFEDEIKVSSGVVITFNKKVKYKIDFIEKIDNEYHLYTHKLTKTSFFIMPMLEGDRMSFRWNTDFCNAFLGMEEIGDYGSSIYLLYRFSGVESFSKFEGRLTKHPWFKKTWDPDRYHVIYEFEIPKKHREYVNLLTEGQYSKIPIILKDRILKFHRSSSNRPIGQILNKSKARKKQLERELGVVIPNDVELYDKFVPEQELYMNRFKIEYEEEGEKIGKKVD